ncbi:Ell-associated factor Eaf [Pseudolycoriella hygida]|uniref:Ell-associated factor Eaf n=1 Tax=Pseudolycoriella hygida TaxID=35572 RepID=A0A9Q0S4T7_9DIPT|nr:Ell-associated factor Eaf [Pseudolycoriella hygida]
MEDRLNFGSDIRELTLGSSFNCNNSTSFHTLKYDFKPTSLDFSKVATVDCSSNNQITVSVPHLDTSSVPKTVYKGNQKKYTKECALIIDKVTGEITLEKLSANIQTKTNSQHAPAWNANNTQSTLASIPMIERDDDVVLIEQQSSRSTTLPVTATEQPSYQQSQRHYQPLNVFQLTHDHRARSKGMDSFLSNIIGNSASVIGSNNNSHNYHHQSQQSPLSESIHGIAVITLSDTSSDSDASGKAPDAGDLCYSQPTLCAYFMIVDF